MRGRVIQQQQDLLPGQVIPPSRGPGLQARAGSAAPRPRRSAAGWPAHPPARPAADPACGACSGRKNCPSGKSPASWCAACTAKVVLPIPAIPPIAWIPTTPTAGRGGTSHRAGQLGQLGHAAGEAGDIAGQRPGRRCRGRGFAGGQHLVRRSPAARRRLEQRPLRPGQAQRTGQQPGRVMAGRQVHAPLQVADRPRGQARRLRQLLLGQPGIIPQPPQQPGEAQCRLLRHRPIAPHQTRPPVHRRRPATARTGHSRQP